MTLRIGISAAALSAFAPGWASAQTPDDLGAALEELLNTRITVASKTAESLNQAPGIITVVSRMEIEGYASQNLGEVLNRVVSMSLLSPDIFPNQSVVVRGQETTPYNNHILVLLDGRPVRDPITGGLNGPTWNSFPLSVVERLEIIRGPGSVLYGSCAYSGVVNIVTRDRKEDGTSGSAALAAGNNGAFTQSGNVLFRSGDFHGIVGATQYMDTGQQESFVDYSGTAGSAKFFHHSLGAVAHLDYRGLTVNAYQGNYDPYTLEGSSETWMNPATRNQQIATHLDTGYSADVSSTVNLGANVTYNRTEWLTGDRWATASPGVPPGTTTGNALLFEFTARIVPTTGFNIILGGGGEKSDWGGALVIDGNQTATFLYAQADYRLDAVKLIGGMQYNKLQDIKGNVSPRLGLVWDVTPEVCAKVLYSSAFRKGYPNETGFNVSIFHGNPLLQPELITTLETQLMYQGKAFQGSLTYYSSQMKDIIIRQVFPNPGATPPIYLKYVNGGTWNFSGFEAEGRYSITPSLLFSASASYQTNKTEAGVENANLHPSTMVKAGFLYHAGGWSAGLFDIYSGAPKATTTVDPTSKVVNPEAGTSNLVSAKVGWKVWESHGRSLNLSVESNNLLDKNITYPDYPNKAVNTFLPLNAGRSVLGSVAILF
jgi:outer membrane receptor for ferrienterochelin and colicin